jgi:hypothetical protein
LTDVNNLGIIENVSAATLRNYSHQPGIGYSHRRNPQHVAEPERDGAICLAETGEANLRAVA